MEIFPTEFNILNFNIGLVSNYEIFPSYASSNFLCPSQMLNGHKYQGQVEFHIKGNDIFLSVCEFSENGCYVTTFLQTVLSKPASLQVKLSAPSEKYRHERS